MTQSTTPARWQVLAAFAAIYFIWGSTYVAIRVGLETIPPFLMAGFRFLIAGSFLFGVARLQGVPMPTQIHWKWALIVGAFLLLAGNGGVTWAEQMLPSGIAALLVATVPLWMVLLDWLRPGGVRPAGQVFAGLGLGLFGILLLVSQGNVSGEINLLAAVALVFTSLMWATGSLLSRQAKLPDSLLMGTGMEMLCGGVLLTLLGTLVGDWSRLDVSAISLDSALAVGYLIFFGAIISYTAYIWLLKVVPAARVATYAFVNPAVAVFLGWALMGEPMTPQTLLAAAIIIVAVIIITSFRARTSVPNRVQFRAEPSTTHSV
jgi:drug/metabolite transporter (DMT)-like permease